VVTALMICGIRGGWESKRECETTVRNVPFYPHGNFASMRPVVSLYKGTRRNLPGGLVLRVETGGVMPLTTDSL